jgi:hypothetical protein
MQLHNLEKNILHRVCEELTRRNDCGPLEIDFVYQAFADIPDEEIALRLRDMANRGWLQVDARRSEIHLTVRGRSKIRAFIPTALLDTCKVKAGC